MKSERDAWLAGIEGEVRFDLCNKSCSVVTEGNTQLFWWLVFVVVLEPTNQHQAVRQRPSHSQYLRSASQSDLSQQLTEAAAALSGLSYSSCYGSCLQEFFHSQLWLAMFLFLDPSDNEPQTRPYIILANLMGMK